MINVAKNNIKATDNANYIVFMPSINSSCLMFDKFHIEYRKVEVNFELLQSSTAVTKRPQSYKETGKNYFIFRSMKKKALSVKTEREQNRIFFVCFDIRIGFIVNKFCVAVHDLCFNKYRDIVFNVDVDLLGGIMKEKSAKNSKI